MKPARISLLLILLAAPAHGQETPTCPVEGDPIHWMADFCMAKLETDDEIAAMDCISGELQQPFLNECLARIHYKRRLCELAVSRQAIAGTVESCFADRDFMGNTVRNKGVGP